jgi:linoleoyl-CoA desaturase
LFSGGGALQRDLRARVAERLTPELVRRGKWTIGLKGAVLVTWAVASYLALLLVSESAWQAVPLAISLGLALAGVAFSIGHDANHGALARGRRTNRVLGLTFDVIGASSYVWRVKHNHAHHSYTNVAGADNDIEQMPLARLAPDQPRRWYHRWQHIYMWLFYGLFSIRHHLVGDIKGMTGGRFGEITPITRPKGLELAIFIAGKLAFVSWALLLPMLTHTWWKALLIFVLVSWVLGLTLATVFQLAHCVEEAEFSSVEELQAGDARPWVVHQVETTVDFATGNRFLTWYLGGLNFQVEHHLFPRVCHVHYPHLADIVRRTCEEHGVRHVTQPTLRAALASHARWLRAMGRPDPAPQAA